jgi:hypothetical protein
LPTFVGQLRFALRGISRQRRAIKSTENREERRTKTKYMNGLFERKLKNTTGEESMKTRMKITNLLAIAVVALSASLGRAATMSTSATAPTVDDEDIAQLVQAGGLSGNAGDLWSNRPVHGQTFMTGSSPTGYTLKAVTLKCLHTATGTYAMRVGSVSGTTFSEVATDSGGSISHTAGDYITATFDTPISLNANTLYGFEWSVSAGGFTLAANTDVNSYAGGTAYSSGANSVPNDASLTLHSGDRVFHLDIAAPLAATPGTLIYGK